MEPWPPPCRPNRIGEQGLVAKLVRAHGECLGDKRRRRAWLAAISSGEPQAGVDPEIPEWGNPAELILGLLPAEYIGGK